jgi:hypothetical protein
MMLRLRVGSSSRGVVCLRGGIVCSRSRGPVFHSLYRCRCSFSCFQVFYIPLVNPPVLNVKVFLPQRAQREKEFFNNYLVYEYFAIQAFPEHAQEYLWISNNS